MASFELNGEPVELEADPEMPLLWALRDLIGLKGTKYGCGVGLCGACTVHIDGVATTSCIIQLAFVEGKQVTTIEGLSPDGSHPLQRAWCTLNVPQCGYCQSGQLMKAAELLQNNASPTDADIDVAMSTNVCRCGTYQRIRAAIHLASQTEE